MVLLNPLNSTCKPDLEQQPPPQNKLYFSRNSNWYFYQEGWYFQVPNSLYLGFLGLFSDNSVYLGHFLTPKSKNGSR